MFYLYVYAVAKQAFYKSILNVALNSTGSPKSAGARFK